MNTDKLINSLCDDLKAIKPMASPFIRAQPFLFLVVAYLAIVILTLGIRSDLASAKLHDTTFMFETLTALAITFSALIASIWMSIPDMRGQKWLPAVPLTLTAVFITWTLARIAGEGIPTHGFEWHFCFSKGMFFAALPIMALVVTSKKGATTHPIMISLMNILCASSMGFIALRLTCANDHFDHAMHHHIAPFIAIGLIAGLLTRRFYRW